MAKKRMIKKYPLLAELLEKGKAQGVPEEKRSIEMKVAGVAFNIYTESKRSDLRNAVMKFMESLNDWKNEKGMTALVASSKIWQLMFFLSEYTDIGDVVSMKDGEILYSLFYDEEAIKIFYDQIADYEDAIEIMNSVLNMMILENNNMLNFVWMSSLPASSLANMVLEAMDDEEKMEALTKDFDLGGYLASSMMSVKADYQEKANKASVITDANKKSGNMIQFPKKDAEQLPFIPDVEDNGE